ALLVSIGPTLGDDQRPAPTGPDPPPEQSGRRLKPGLTFERAPAPVRPAGRGGGPSLPARRRPAITQGLVQGDAVRYRVLLQLAQGLEPLVRASSGNAPAGEPPARLTPLLSTSERAFAVLNAARLAEGNVELDQVEHDSDGPFTVA